MAHVSMNRIGAPQHLEGQALLEWLQDPNNPPMYTRELISAWQQYLYRMNVLYWGKIANEIPKTYLQYPTEVTGHDVYGKATTYVNCGPKKPILHNTFQLSYPEHPRPYPCVPRLENHIISLSDWNSTSMNLDWKECCGLEKLKYLEPFVEMWKKNSDFLRSVKAHIRKHGKKMVLVKRIVCFGLGPRKRKREGDSTHTHIIRSVLQHETAIAIRDTLREVQTGVQGHLLNITVQDPHYCPGCYVRIWDVYDGFIATNPAGFNKVDGDTFVISRAPTIHVRQIVGDLTAGSGGPAGILCDEIEEDYNRFHSCKDPPSGRLWKFKKENEELELMLDDSNVRTNVFHKVGLYLRKRSEG
jgi:hypothetical protein